MTAIIGWSPEDKRRMDAVYSDFLARTGGGKGRPGRINPPNDAQEEWFKIVSNDTGGDYTVQRQVWKVASGWDDDTTAQFTAWDYRLVGTGLAGQIVKGWRAYDSTGNWRMLLDVLGGGGAAAGGAILVKVQSHDDRDNNNEYEVQQCNPDGTTMTGSSILSGVANLRETGCAVLASGALVQGYIHPAGSYYIDHHAGYLFRGKVTVVPGASGYHLKILDEAAAVPAGAVALTDFTVTQDLNQRSLMLQSLDTGAFPAISVATAGLTWTAGGATGAQTDWLPEVDSIVWALVRPAPYGDRYIICCDQWDMGNF